MYNIKLYVKCRKEHLVDLLVCLPKGPFEFSFDFLYHQSLGYMVKNWSLISFSALALFMIGVGLFISLVE